jgi:lysozyme
MTNLVFNMGPGGVLTFQRFNTLMARGDYAAAADALLDSKWATQVGSRRAEQVASMIRTGSYGR